MKRGTTYLILRKCRNPEPFVCKGRTGPGASLPPHGPSDRFSDECSNLPGSIVTQPRAGKGYPLKRRKSYDKKLIMLLDRASGIFAENGYHNTSVRDVAAVTGISPAGLYYYFQSKEELLHLILESCLSSLLGQIRLEVNGITDPSARLRTIIRTHLDHHQKNKNGMRVLVHEWESLSGSFGREIRGFMREYLHIAVGTFQELFPEKDPKELRANAFGLFGMLSWVDQWYRPERDLPIELLAEQFSGIFLGGRVPVKEQASSKGESEEEDSASRWSKKTGPPSLLSGPGF